MKKSIRRGVFETNSSSTHSLTICPKSQFDEWNEGGIWMFDEYEDSFIPYDEVKYDAIKDDWDNYLSLSFDEYASGHEYLDSFCEKYITKNGDEIVAFGVYGHNG